MSKLYNSAQLMIAGGVLIALLYTGSAVFAPVTFAFLIIMLVWPMQRALELVLQRYIALAIGFLFVVVLLGGWGWLIAWTLGQVGRRIAADAARFQILYEQFQIWLEAHGLAISVLWSDNFDVSWIMRNVQSIGRRLNSTLSFWIVALIYILLGLAETNDFGARIRGMKNKALAHTFLRGCREAAAKVRQYMLLRAAMSFITGVLVWGLTLSVGLPFASTWGFVAFILNFIPFIGPFVATLFITVFSFTQFANWEWVLAVFVGLNIIQSAVGSILEPRLAGSALSLSPVVVLFSVFAWGALWGIFGAFIGVPITIVVLTFCAQYSGTSWFAELFNSSRKQT